MPIIDYAEKAKRTHERFFADPAISAMNKEYVADFLIGYDVSDARRDIFLENLRRFLRHSKDLAKEMHDRRLINPILSKLRPHYSTATYITIVNITLRFARWINQGERPKGFSDIRSTSLKKQFRSLQASDMIVWADVGAMCHITNSIQIRAMLSTQLDGGFRPSEFIDLNFGDVAPHGDVFSVEVRRGKTGPRTVYLYDAVPHLALWLRHHPTKRAQDPLWIRETGKSRGVARYEYPALSKRVRYLGKQAGIDKPFDFYNFRHSAIAQKKKERMDPLWSCRNFGHSMAFYEQVYGRLSNDDYIDSLRRHKGAPLQATAPKRASIVVCTRCSHANPALDDAGKPLESCESCAAPFTLKKALEADKASEMATQLQEMREQYDNLAEKMKVLEVLDRYVEAKLARVTQPSRVQGAT